MVRSLARVIVSVSDLRRSAGFYADALGFEPYWESGELARLRSGSVDLLLHERGAESSDLGVAIAYEVDDVDRAAADAVAHGGSVVDPPGDQPWGERQSVLRDPDGHVICVVASIPA
ncbi:VOC family protein [Agromyces sp. MMS24-K17]|uniref:VOC family protein n=1 Tax=Agromyces sp. MMS24-K17 TaxID=3372850 RepID=UPI003754C0CF